MVLMPVERMTEVMQECDKYELRLANDPTILGPKYLQDMIATCRNYTNHVARLLNEVARVKMELNRDLRRKQTAFKIAADELLAKNIVVRNLPSIKDRESQINIMLKDEHREIVTLENDVLDISHVENYITRRHRELKDTMREIQSQRNLIRDEHATGSMYGDERPTSMGHQDTSGAFNSGGFSKPDGMDESEIEQMLNDAKTPEAPVPQNPVVASKAATEEDMIRAFLDGSERTTEQAKVPPITAPEIAKSQSVVAEDDFSELLNSL